MGSAKILNMSKSAHRALVESASIVGESAREDGAWKVRLISEGQGSSAFYTRRAIEGGTHVFNDALSFKNHPGEWEGPETRDFTMIVGEILGEVWHEDDERGMAAMYGWYLPDPEYRDRIERYKKKIALSIYAMGEAEHNDDTGRFEVTEFIEDPYTSIDVVIAPGARGGFVEAARKFYANRVENASAASAEENENKEGFSEMEIKELGDKIDALTAAITASSESQKVTAQAEADSAAVESAVQAGIESYAAKAAAVEAADLLPSQVKELLAQAARGQEITESLESAKAIVKEAREAHPAAPAGAAGQFTENAASDYKLRGFGGKK